MDTPKSVVIAAIIAVALVLIAVVGGLTFSAHENRRANRAIVTQCINNGGTPMYDSGGRFICLSSGMTLTTSEN